LVLIAGGTGGMRIGKRERGESPALTTAHNGKR